MSTESLDHFCRQEGGDYQLPVFIFLQSGLVMTCKITRTTRNYFDPH